MAVPAAQAVAWVRPRNSNAILHEFDDSHHPRRTPTLMGSVGVCFATSPFGILVLACYTLALCGDADMIADIRRSLVFSLPSLVPRISMRLRFRLTFAALLFAVATTPLAAADLEVPKGFTPLFNGKDLTGWHGWAIHSKGGTPADLAKLTPEERTKKIAEWTEDAKKHWSVQNGELVNDGFGAYLATDKELGDYELLIEYKTVAKADSGIYLKNAPQVQIWDSTDPSKFKIGGDKGSGGLWNNSAGAPGKDPLVKADKPFGEWNKFRIIQVGARTTIYLNDQLVVDHAILENYWNRKEPLPLLGSVILQTHGGEIRWRNIFLKELTPTAANEILRTKHATGFTPIFDGKTLEGWTGAADDYEVKDGSIVCKPKKGGNLFTKKTYGDFTARVEYKLPPGGNNGLAIRYPGTGTPSATGFCEVQILDDTAEKYSKLKEYQYNGSVYTMIPAVRGYGRPVGEWNFMEVTVKGSNIIVELNGNVIVNGDAAKVDPTRATRTEGHFGFAGHSDPVEFRNVSIKPITK